jgi:hypothetical protein
MEPGDPFPIERCSPRLKTAILAEFDGRSPTFQDILSIPLDKWLTVPGMGRRLLSELESVTQGGPSVAQADPVATSHDSDLMARIERLQHDLQRLKHDIQSRLSETPMKRSDRSSSGSR